MHFCPVSCRMPELSGAAGAGAATEVAAQTQAGLRDDDRLSKQAKQRPTHGAQAQAQQQPSQAHPVTSEFEFS